MSVFTLLNMTSVIMYGVHRLVAAIDGPGR